MEIILGKTSGFCGGVLRSVRETEKILEENGKIYCLGDLVHNKQVVEKLESKGLKVIDNIDEIFSNHSVIIRAHGVPKEVYEKAKAKNIKLIDLTCLNVIKIHELAISLEKAGYFIVLVGQRSHPETIGTISFCGQNSLIIEGLDEINLAVKTIQESRVKKVAVIAQTTYSLDLYDKIFNLLQDYLGSDYELKMQKTICDATELRQKECKKIASQVDAMIIIGGKHSSNTFKLYDTALTLCKNTTIIETSDELFGDYSAYEKVGVMAGASTPKSSIDAVIKKLGDIDDRKVDKKY